MDKREFKDYTKLLTKIYIYLMLIITIPINIIMSIIYSISNGNFLNKFISNIISTTIIFTSLLLLIYLGMFIVSKLIENQRKKDMLLTDKYIRELPKNFPPAISSFLLDLSLETTTDYTATIAYLISKKYLELKNDTFIVKNNNVKNLSSHEQYVFSCLTGKNAYNQEEFIKLVINDAENMELIQKGRRKIHFFRNFCISILIYFIFSIISEFISNELKSIFTILTTISSISIFSVIVYSIYLLLKYDKENYYRTKLGNEEALKWSGLKKFFHEFTLIKDKTLNDLILLDDYIPYAISLNEAKSIEKYIEKNDIYRNIIYKNISK